MSRMHEIEQRLSMIREKHRHVVYLTTEDRDILPAVFEEMAELLKSFVTDKKQALMLQNISGDCFYPVVRANHILEDAYEAFDLKERNYIKNEFFSEREEPGRMFRAVSPSFFLLNDFHILRETAASHFLKQFLSAAAREEQEQGRFLILFLVSPILRCPKGFEGEIEVIDVPEMDQGDVEDFLSAQAVREYGAGLGSASIDSVEKKRIVEAARDLRGISKKGILEILADLRAEYGSFFGRTADGSGTEKNLRHIVESRKRLVAELKKKEARYDSTVTMIEPQEAAIEGLKEFLCWIDAVKEEFLDEEKAFRFGNKPPKGVLLTGIPGSGKTQAAKQVAFRMGGLEGNVPLVQFRMDNLLGGLVGDSEANFKRCRKRIEALSPCIVLLDEIEKTFDTEGKSSSNDVKMNILTALLDWMQENERQIFFFATSNSVVHLKPELLRDGRFDMRFCVFMPTHDELVEIFRLHMEHANRRANGRLFQDADYRETARSFLSKITEYARAKEKNMFFTGANVENLITQANRDLKRQAEKKRSPRPYRQEEYLEALLCAAKGKYCQPYGVTNRKDIVEFWLSAYKNQYTNAASLDLFPFTAYDEEACAFRKQDLIKPEHDYDAYLFERISAEISKAHKERKES